MADINKEEPLPGEDYAATHEQSVTKVAQNSSEMNTQEDPSMDFETKFDVIVGSTDKKISTSEQSSIFSFRHEFIQPELPIKFKKPIFVKKDIKTTSKYVSKDVLDVELDNLNNDSEKGETDDTRKLANDGQGIKVLPVPYKV